jgi:hypothetical protein
MTKVKHELNQVLKTISGKPMNQNELALLEVLQHWIKTGEISVEKAHRIWNEREKS